VDVHAAKRGCDFGFATFVGDDDRSRPVGIKSEFYSTEYFAIQSGATRRDYEVGTLLKLPLLKMSHSSLNAVNESLPRSHLSIRKPAARKAYVDQKCAWKPGGYLK
jgi:hypothetical protein